ncbi:GNAT family N-acetyltransferase [Companilactobacillus jidongensis]|uniref:GNAT family N-acetyltransferase n=1 Tax=Companilactobacillus jidongensis TaxID=2486006 RepID=UPI000F7B7378|nr:GNAT family N-acetyltransferase [Companilactobacillus jidongensis]
MIRESNIKDAEGIATVNLESWQETYSGIVDADFLNSMDLSKAVDRWTGFLNDPDVKIFVDVEKDTVVGYIRAEVKNGKACIGAIYLLKDYQKMGIGKELLLKGLDYLKQQNYKNIFVDVLFDNPTKYFYQKFGAEPFEERTLKIGEQELAESVYAWNFE